MTNACCGVACRRRICADASPHQNAENAPLTISSGEMNAATCDTAALAAAQASVIGVCVNDSDDMPGDGAGDSVAFDDAAAVGAPNEATSAGDAASDATGGQPGASPSTEGPLPAGAERTRQRVSSATSGLSLKRTARHLHPFTAVCAQRLPLAAALG